MSRWRFNHRFGSSERARTHTLVFWTLDELLYLWLAFGRLLGLLCRNPLRSPTRFCLEPEQISDSSLLHSDRIVIQSTQSQSHRAAKRNLGWTALLLQPEERTLNPVPARGPTFLSSFSKPDA